jgi:uracil-DNA glycosylase
MTDALHKSAAQELAARLEFYRELGIYDFYRRGSPDSASTDAVTADTEIEVQQVASTAAADVSHPIPVSAAPPAIPALQESTIPRRTLVSNQPVPPLVSFGPVLAPEQRPDALTAIRDLIGDCQRCGLAKGRNKIVFADGDANAQLMFVGEGPGADEDAQGLPFVGRAGQLLTQMIDGTASKEGIPIKRADVYICNVVKCRPPENRTPQPDEMEICGQFLFRQLMTLRPKAICALGSTAAKALLATKDGVMRLRGNWHKWHDIPVMVTYHPSYLLRPYNQNAKREAWDDLKKVLHFVYD